LPRDYVPGQRLKIEVYRRLSRIRRAERLGDFRQELRDRFGAPPEAAEWLLRLAELRLLAARWQVATVHLEGIETPISERTKPLVSSAPRLPLSPPHSSGRPVDVVLGYRNPRKIQRLAKRSGGRLRIVDDSSAYFRLIAEELEPLALYTCLKDLLHPPSRSL
jgi:transcription-repair coupling factor (superfamily II helicase)